MNNPYDKFVVCGSLQQRPPVKLPISASESGIITVPIPILQTMFEKAANLLLTDGNIVLKPGGTDGSYAVAGLSNRILVITPGKGGSLTCDRQCSNRSTVLCEHTLAVAARRSIRLVFYLYSICNLNSAQTL